MKNLIAELLVKLAQKEEESKELVAQVEALEIVVTALLRQMAKNEQQTLIENVEGALEQLVQISRRCPAPHGCLVRLFDLSKNLRFPQHHGIEPGNNPEQMPDAARRGMPEERWTFRRCTAGSDPIMQRRKALLGIVGCRIKLHPIAR